jgi:hypothetical protein
MYATLERLLDHGDRFGIVVPAIERAHAHAAQAEGADTRAVAAEGAGLHDDHLL